MTDLFSGILEAGFLLLLVTVAILTRYAFVWHADMLHAHRRLTQIEEEMRLLPERCPVRQQLAEMRSPRPHLPESKPGSIELIRQYIQLYYPTLISNVTEQSNETLSSSDELLCMLIKLEYTNKEIASILSITNNSVITARYRLKRKLGLWMLLSSFPLPDSLEHSL